MKALVTGGSGFLGSHVADALSAEGHEVVLFDTVDSPYRSSHQAMYVGSVLDDVAIASAMADCDVIYHMAAVADLNDAIRMPVKTMEVNVLGTAKMLEAARLRNIERFVFASSIYVYSNHGSFYRTSKRACELLIEDFWEQYNLPFTILRFGSLYGPRADEHNSIYRMLLSALQDGQIRYVGTGEEIREYIHVIDAAHAAIKILGPDFKNENISLTGRERMRTREMLEMINEIMGGKVELEFEGIHQDGHYVQTPYNYTPKIGKKLVQEKYIDVGLGLLDCLQEMGMKLRTDAPDEERVTVPGADT